MDFLTGWEEGKDYGRINSSFTKDYINQTVWNMPVDYIAIVRHQRVLTKLCCIFFNI